MLGDSGLLRETQLSAGAKPRSVWPWNLCPSLALGRWSLRKLKWGGMGSA